MKMPSDQPYYGSSPLTRGTQGKTYKELDVDRFIPAYAGNSHTQVIQSLTDYGSSPLTRGTHRSRTEVFTANRFIPAYAGNSAFWFSYSQPCLGSSPLTRGTQLLGLLASPIGRFIPAYAGNSDVRELNLPGNSVHPRLRGELVIRLRQVAEYLGSSPLTRGTRVGLLSHVIKRSVHPRLRGELT